VEVLVIQLELVVIHVKELTGDRTNVEEGGLLVNSELLLGKLILRLLGAASTNLLHITDAYLHQNVINIRSRILRRFVALLFVEFITQNSYFGLADIIYLLSDTFLPQILPCLIPRIPFPVWCLCLSLAHSILHVS